MEEDEQEVYQQGYSEVDQQQLQEGHYEGQLGSEEPMNEEPPPMEEVTETDRVSNKKAPELGSITLIHILCKAVVVEEKTPEQIKMEQREARIKAEVEREHEEQMRLLKEKKRKEKEPPPPPKTITVMAGSRNRPSWPIAPGIANANTPREITLTSGEDNQEDLMRARFEIAQAAGLKHVDIIHGDENFYPTPLKDYGKNEGTLRLH